MRLVGIDIPDGKKIAFALPAIYGIGQPLARVILKTAHIDPEKRTKDLTPVEANRLKEVIEKSYTIEGDLRREIMLNIKRMKELHLYRGIRHLRGLPVRGQRTKTNSRTRRGNVRKTVGSGKKAPPSPT